MTKYDKIQITDITDIRFPDIGHDLLQKLNSKCKHKNNQSRVNDFIKAIKSYSPTQNTSATTIPPIGTAFMYVETSSNNHGSDSIFVSFERYYTNYYYYILL